MVHQPQGGGDPFFGTQDGQERLIHLAAAAEFVVDQVQRTTDQPLDPDVEADAMLLGQFEDPHQHRWIFLHHRLVRDDQFALQDKTAVADGPTHEVAQDLEPALVAPDAA